ncbi:MAG: sigma 54-interacting transcriptional regulator, partial [Acetobacteraceae bacterium]|nr:sigma 54-interacting transcriptional regulator [Acetobacteraceae bacterium]
MSRAGKPALLVVDDDVGLCSQYKWAFSHCEVSLAHARPPALAIAQKERPAVVVLDLGLPPDADGVSEGFATLDALSRLLPETKTILVTGNGERAHALRAVNSGAYDFCEKPVDIAVLRSIVDRGLRLHDLEAENRRLRETTGASPIRQIVTGDDGMLRVCRTVERLAATNVTVLLLGESGTGKEVAARALHRLSGRAGPFLAVNCGAIPAELAESQLFGHLPGAFTSARAGHPGFFR